MEPIKQGMQGPAVEDVQSRLTSLGYTIDAAETTAKDFGPSTAAAVNAFCADNGLDAADQIDVTSWSALVDASYRLGDRTLYLRMPNFHGADVRALQHALNTLGFACGPDDGYFGPHTEAALREFQENVGLFADGMAFQDTFNYVARLHHVWEGKASVSEVGDEAHMGFARAATVLENWNIAIGGVDAIARNVASRIWNIATATTDNSGVVLCDDQAPEDSDLVIEIASDELPEDAEPRATISLASCHNLPLRIKTAVAAATRRPALLRIELTGISSYGVFTSSDAQTLAIRLLDGLCDALSDEVR